MVWLERGNRRAGGVARRGLRGEGGASGSAIATVPISEEEHRVYYLGYSNSVLWPVFHNRLDLAQFEAGFYHTYVDVNRRFAEKLRALLEPDDVIWVHDYHLIPLAQELRKLGVTAPIGFFLHIPAPPSQTFLAIPEHLDLARALSAYDLIGVQTQADVANLIGFLEDSVAGRILQDGRINVFERRLAIASFPVGIDLPDFEGGIPTRPVAQAPAEAKRIIGIDRLDYTKGLPQKFRAYERFLEKYDTYRKKVVLSQIAPPTREDVEAYTDIRRDTGAPLGLHQWPFRRARLGAHSLHSPHDGAQAASVTSTGPPRSVWLRRFVTA